MHWKKPSRLELFTEDFYCPVIFEAEAKLNNAFPSQLSLIADSAQEGRHPTDSQSQDNLISNNVAVDENCNIILEEAIYVQEPEDHNYTSQEQEEIDLKVENAIASDPDAVLDKADVAEAWTNTSQSHMLDAASGISQVLMVECGAGASQPWMIECGIQTSQDFGLRTLEDDNYGKSSPKRKLRSTSPATRKCDAPIVLPRLPIQTSGPEVPVKIRRMDEGLRTIYSVASECYDFEDSNKENSSTVIYHRGYKNKGRIPASKLKNHSDAMDDNEVAGGNEGECHGPLNELTSSRGTFLRVGLSKKSRALKPLHTKVPFAGQHHFNIPTPISKKVEIEDEEDE